MLERHSIDKDNHQFVSGAMIFGENLEEIRHRCDDGDFREHLVTCLTLFVNGFWSPKINVL